MKSKGTLGATPPPNERDILKRGGKYQMSKKPNAIPGGRYAS